MLEYTQLSIIPLFSGNVMQCHSISNKHDHLRWNGISSLIKSRDNINLFAVRDNTASNTAFGYLDCIIFVE